MTKEIPQILIATRKLSSLDFGIQIVHSHIQKYSQIEKLQLMYLRQLQSPTTKIDLWLLTTHHSHKVAHMQVIQLYWSIQVLQPTK